MDEDKPNGSAEAKGNGMTMVPETAPLDVEVRNWTVRRIDIRSPVLPNTWPVVRLELEHPERGRVTDIGEAPGAFDAAFIAAGRIVGARPRLLSYNVRSAAPVDGPALPISVVIGIELNGIEFNGSSVGIDLVRCSVEAWLDAIARSEERIFGSLNADRRRRRRRSVR